MTRRDVVIRGGVAAVALMVGLLSAVTAAVARPADAAACGRPADCGVRGVCVAGSCREGAERATIAELHGVAIEATRASHDQGWLTAVASEATAQLRADIIWTGFYGVLDLAPVPRGPVARAALERAGVHRVIRSSVTPTEDPGAVRLQLRAVSVSTEHAVTLPSGDVVVRPGGMRAAVARWVNALVGHDTGLPSVVGTRVLASAMVRPGVKEIVVFDSDGGAASWVTANGSINLHPTWGPGGVIGYMSYARGNPDWMVDGVALSDRSGLNAAGAWSPDGRTLALTVTDGANSDIVVLDAITGAERARLTSHRGVDTSPAWSPDGRRLAFVSDRTGSPQIWLMEVDGSRQERLTSGGYVTSPAWSPLGDVIVYAQRIGGSFALMRHDLASGRVRRLSPSGASSEAPAFSPDGRLVIYARRPAEGGAQRLWTVRMDGSDARPVTPPEGASLTADLSLFSPDWGPVAHKGESDPGARSSQIGEAKPVPEPEGYP